VNLFFKLCLMSDFASVDLTQILSHSRDYEELLHVWRAWRDAVGPPIRSKYIRYVQLANHAARLNGK
jgi:peptidyl-dipeptidase A